MSTPARIAQSARRILIVDDNPKIHDDFGKVLGPKAAAAPLDEAEAVLFGTSCPSRTTEPPSFDLSFAHRGEEGFRLIEESVRDDVPYALAFIDIRMAPGWDGIRTVTELWRLDPRLQVVLCTAYSDYAWEDMVAKLGPKDDFLILKKPFDAIEVSQITHALTQKWLLLREKESHIQKLAEQQQVLVRKERLAVLGQLAGGVAHQIRNPLAAIMNATYVLKRHLVPEQHPHVDDAICIIHDEVRRANVIITGLLDYARVRTPDRHPALIGEIVKRVLAEGIPRNVNVECLMQEVPMLDIDTDQIHGAILNLVRNAVEAMGDGGILRIALRLDRDNVLVSVTDTGSGISPQIRAHLFEPLRSTKPMGIGLGLVTARTFVEAHGGRIDQIDVASGAHFEIRIPVGMAVMGEDSREG